MKPEVIILIITNIVVPIAVAIITAIAQSKKYKKEIQLLNAEHKNKLKEIQSEYEHKIEILELQHKHQQELETQKTGNTIQERFTTILFSTAFRLSTEADTIAIRNPTA